MVWTRHYKAFMKSLLMIFRADFVHLMLNDAMFLWLLTCKMITVMVAIAKPKVHGPHLLFLTSHLTLMMH